MRPESLTRQDIVSALAPVKPILAQCFDGTPGDGTVKISISASGRITGAAVTGTFAGLPVGDCIASAAHVAVFRATRRESTTIVFPYALRAPAE
jgi:hypothetical protein